MKVPLLDLKLQYQSIKDDINQALLRVAESQMLILGEEVEKIEKSLADYCEVQYAVGVSSGTDALLAALMALDIEPWDEVIMPTYSFFATAGVVARLRAIPIFADSDPQSFNIDPNAIEPLINARTKAIMPVHLFGQCAAMKEIMEISEKYNIPVIEDAAQAIGAQYLDGRRAGSIGTMGCFSFYPSKNLGCFGDGGLITTNDEALAVKLKKMRNHGMAPKYHHGFVGGNFRLDAIQAAVLSVKFPHLEDWHEARRDNAALYTNFFIEKELSEEEGLIQFDKNNQVLLPKSIYKDYSHQNHHIYNQYSIRVKNRDEMRNFLANEGISTEVYYPVPFHRQECFKYLNPVDEMFPVANTLADESLALPIYPELTVVQIEYVVDKIKEFIEK